MKCVFNGGFHTLCNTSSCEWDFVWEVVYARSIADWSIGALPFFLVCVACLLQLFRCERKIRIGLCVLLLLSLVKFSAALTNDELVLPDLHLFQTHQNFCRQE